MPTISRNVITPRLPRTQSVRTGRSNAQQLPVGHYVEIAKARDAKGNYYLRPIISGLPPGTYHYRSRVLTSGPGGSNEVLDDGAVYYRANGVQVLGEFTVPKLEADECAFSVVITDTKGQKIQHRVYCWV